MYFSIKTKIALPSDAMYAIFLIVHFHPGAEMAFSGTISTNNDDGIFFSLMRLRSIIGIGKIVCESHRFSKADNNIVDT